MRIALLALLLVAAGWAQAPKVGTRYQVFSVDLNHDAKVEKVGLRCYREEKGNWDSRLTVWNAQGKVVWESPRDWSFGGWDYGISDLQLVADLDGDGSIEAISPLPVSDVSPVTYRVYRWSGKAFVKVREAALIQAGPDEFWWNQSQSEVQRNSWIGHLGPGRGGIQGRVWTLNGAKVLTRDVNLRGTPRGFKLIR